MRRARPARRRDAAARTGRCRSSSAAPPKSPAGASGWAADDGRPVVAFAPGAVGPSKRWPAAAFAELARRLTAQGVAVWVLGSPGEAPLAARSSRDGRPEARDLTGTDLRNAILALAAADVAVSNDSGLLHVAAAIGTPTIGIFGPTSPWHWAPLNPLAAAIETATDCACQPCHKPTCRLRHHRCMRDISADQVLEVTQRTLAQARASLARDPLHRSAAHRSTDGMSPSVPTISIFPAPSGPCWPGSVPTKIAASGTPSAAARCNKPVSTPTTKAARAIIRAT